MSTQLSRVTGGKSFKTITWTKEKRCGTVTRCIPFGLMLQTIQETVFKQWKKKDEDLSIDICMKAVYKQ